MAVGLRRRWFLGSEGLDCVGDLRRIAAWGRLLCRDLVRGASWRQAHPLVQALAVVSQSHQGFFALGPCRGAQREPGEAEHRLDDAEDRLDALPAGACSGHGPVRCSFCFWPSGVEPVSRGLPGERRRSQVQGQREQASFGDAERATAFDGQDLDAASLARATSAGRWRPLLREQDPQALPRPPEIAARPCHQLDAAVAIWRRIRGAGDQRSARPAGHRRGAL